jgi:hypothetical protein
VHFSECLFLQMLPPKKKKKGARPSSSPSFLLTTPLHKPFLGWAQAGREARNRALTGVAWIGGREGELELESRDPAGLMDFRVPVQHPAEQSSLLGQEVAGNEAQACSLGRMTRHWVTKNHVASSPPASSQAVQGEGGIWAPSPPPQAAGQPSVNIITLLRI